MAPPIFDRAAITLGIGPHSSYQIFREAINVQQKQLECGPMPNVMAALPNIGGALCSTPQCLSDADAHYSSAVQYCCQYRRTHDLDAKHSAKFG